MGVIFLVLGFGVGWLVLVVASIGWKEARHLLFNEIPWRMKVARRFLKARKRARREYSALHKKGVVPHDPAWCQECAMLVVAMMNEERK